MKAGVWNECAKPIDRFDALKKKTEEWEEETNARLIAAVLGQPTSTVKKSDASSSSSDESATADASAAKPTSAWTKQAVTPQAPAADDEKIRKEVKALVARSQRGYAMLYEAMPEDLRPQVAHLSSGNANALWTWIQRKFQSTEVDAVSTLIRQWMQMRMAADEPFDAYRARVDEVDRLLTAAKEPQSRRVYAYVMLDQLQPRYNQAVLALKASDKLKEQDKINWRRSPLSSTRMSEMSSAWTATTTAALQPRRWRSRTRSQRTLATRAMASRRCHRESIRIPMPSLGVTASCATSLAIEQSIAGSARMERMLRRSQLQLPPVPPRAKAAPKKLVKSRQSRPSIDSLRWKSMKRK